MRQIYLQKEFYHLGKKVIIKPSEGAKDREQILRLWEVLRSKGSSSKEASELLGVSRASLYRWKRRLEREGWKGLEQRSRRPKQVRKRLWSLEEIEAVRSYRLLYPCWGKEKIRVLLEVDGIKLSASSIGRIIRYLKSRKAIPELRYKGRWKGRRKQKRPYAIRKPRSYQAERPGDIVQVDTLDIHPFPAIHFKHFLNQLIKRAPFPIRAIQVDGGSEYKAAFEQACQDLGISLFVLPPRAPKLNGCVERAHRTHLDEFNALYEPDSDLERLNKALRSWEWVYNNVRPHRALDYLTPQAVY